MATPVSQSNRPANGPIDARRLLVITYHFDPNGTVGGLRWAGLAKALARLGWKVAVITAAPPVGNGTAGGVQVEPCLRLWTFIDCCRLLRRLGLGRSLGSSPNPTGVGRGSAPPGLLRQLGREVAAFLAFPDESRGWLLRAVLRARSVIRRFQPQVVVSSGPPHSAHLVAGMATIGSAVRWWIDLRDPWAGPVTKVWETHHLLGTRIYGALSSRLERLAFRAAQGVISNTQPLAQAIAARYPDLPVAWLPNGVDSESLPSPASDPYPGVSIAYAGTLYVGRDLGPVVRALRIFLERHPDAARAGSKLRIAGQAGARHVRAFHEAVAAAGMEQYVEVLGRLPRAEALTLVSRSRLAVVLAQEQELQIPAKLYESIAMGIPTLVVAPADSAAGAEGARLRAIVRDPGDVEGIAGVLEELWQEHPRPRSACPPGITYEAIAPLADKLLTTSLVPS